MVHGKSERYENIENDPHVELYVPSTMVCRFVQGSSEGYLAMVFTMNILLCPSILLMNIGEHFAHSLVHHGALKLDDHRAPHVRSPVGCCRNCTRGVYVGSVLGVNGFSKSTFQFYSRLFWQVRFLSCLLRFSPSLPPSLSHAPKAEEIFA